METYRYNQLSPNERDLALKSLSRNSIPRKPIATQSTSTSVEQFDDALPTRKSSARRDTNIPTTKWHRFQEFRANTWFEEYVALSFAILCLAGLIGLFVGIHAQPLSVWHTSVQPNTVVSILVTVMDMAIAFFVASSIGQLKWMRLCSKSQTLDDLQALDSASRGAFGSLALVFSQGAGKLGISGATVVILTLAVGPFTQQVLKFPGALVPQRAPAIASSAVKFNEGLSIEGIDVYATLGMQSSIYGALVNGANESNVMQAPFDCPTSNCTWSPFETLGLCGGCTNLTNHLTATILRNATPPLINYTLPKQYDGLSLVKQAPGVASGSNIDLLMVVQGLSTDTYESGMWPAWQPVLNFAMINSSTYNNSMVSAVSCKIDFCVQSVQANVTNGALKEERTSIPFEWKNVSMNGDNEVYLVTDKSRFFVNSEASAGLATTLGNFFNNASAYMQLSDGEDESVLFTLDIATALFYQNTASMIHLLATSMSTHMRNANSSVAIDGTPSDLSSAAVFGTSYLLEQSFEVRWPWLILPILSVLFATLFFLSVVSQTKRVNATLWKNNLVALLLHGLDSGTRRKLEQEAGDDLYSMQRVAQRVSVRMRRGDAGHLELAGT